MKTKITAEEAFEIISQNARPLCAERMPLIKALGRYLADDIHAPIALPPFDNSAVDGYAISCIASAGERLRVAFTIGAGETAAALSDQNFACRIMTGAKIPVGTKAVIMQENVACDDEYIVLQEDVKEGDNIRWAGEDVEKGVTVIGKGERITPGKIGLLAALGINEVLVVKKPTISVVSTGSELIDPGNPLLDGKVYFCTGPMLQALSQSQNLSFESVAKIEDDKDAIVAALRDIKTSDIIIMVGGMAQGLYDYGRYAFDKVGVKPIFFEGQWRPGKPLFFGKLNEKLVFGLPGNPVAAFVMFKIFVESAIAGLSGGNPVLSWKKGKLFGEPVKGNGKSQFLRAKNVDSVLHLMKGQGSHQIFSLSLADAIVWVRPDRSGKLDEEVDYLMLES